MLLRILDFFISFLGFPLQPHAADRPRCCGASWWRAAAAAAQASAAHVRSSRLRRNIPNALLAAF